MMTTIVTKSQSVYTIRETDGRFYLTGKSATKERINYTDVQIEKPSPWPIAVTDRPTFRLFGTDVWDKYGAFTVSRVESVDVA